MEYIQVFLNNKIIKFLQKIYLQEIKNRKSIKLYKVQSYEIFYSSNNFFLFLKYEWKSKKIYNTIFLHT